MAGRFHMTERYKAAVNAVVPLVAAVPRGEKIDHATIEAAAGIPRRSPNWGYLVQLVKRACRERLGVCLWAEVPGTLTVLTAADQLAVPAQKRGRRAARQLTMAEREVGATPDDLLSDHQRLTKAYRLDALRGQQDAIKLRNQIVEAMTRRSSR